MKGLFHGLQAKTTSIICVLLLGMATAVATQAESVKREKETYEFQERWLVAPGQDLEFQFESLGSEDFVAFGPSEDRTARILCAVIDPNRVPSFIRKVAPGSDVVTRLGESQVIVRRENGEPMFTYAGLPRDTRFLVRVGDEVGYVGSVRHGVVWAGGAWEEADEDLNAARALGRMTKRFLRSEVRRSSSPESLHTIPFHMLQRVRYIEPAIAQGSDPVRRTLLVELRVDESGAVEDLQLLRGPEELFAAARPAIAAWRFQPYLLDGEPVRFRTLVLIPVRNEGAVSAVAGDTSGVCCGRPDR